MPEISIVIPVYGCDACLVALHRRLTTMLAGLDVGHEIVYVDDRSPDGAWNTLLELAAEDPAVRLVRLSRNWGQHAAVTAGLQASRGRWAVVMDCDLQDPPEEIPRLYATALEGNDIVLTRRDRRRQTMRRRIAAVAYLRLRSLFLGIKIDPEYGSMSILSRKVVDSFLSVGDHHRQYMLILHWLGFHRAVIEVAHGERPDGRSSYGLRSLLTIAADGMFFQTTVLLRKIVYAGFAIAFCGLLAAAYFIYSYFVADPLPGWTSVVVLMLVLSGVIIVTTGITGMYVGKIFEQVKGRPSFVVDTVVPADPDAEFSSGDTQDSEALSSRGILP